MPAPVAPVLFAHRGFSAAHPEMTLAAYQAAIAWCADRGVPLAVECDVHFSADDQLICLHDLDVDRTSDQTGPAFQRTVAELKKINFAAQLDRPSTAAERTLVTLVDLLDLVQQARAAGVDVRLAIETKHPNPRGTEVEERVAQLLVERHWEGPDSPCRVISFSVPGIQRIGRLLPAIERTFLIERAFGEWTDGSLPDRVRIAGPDLSLIKQDPGYVARAHAHGNQVHVWTVNTPADVAFCLDLGVTGLTSDVPDLIESVLRQGQDGPGPLATGIDS